MKRPYMILTENEYCDQRYDAFFTDNPLIAKKFLKDIQSGEERGFVFSIDSLQEVTEIKISVETIVEELEDGQVA